MKATARQVHSETRVVDNSQKEAVSRCVQCQWENAARLKLSSLVTSGFFLFIHHIGQDKA